MKKQMICSVVVAWVCTSITYSQMSSPANTVRLFYKFDRSHSQIFNRRNIDERKSWFSASLYQLFLNEMRREATDLKKNPTDKPHFGDGLPFQPLNEPCEADGKTYRNRYDVVPGKVKRSDGHVTVRFFYPFACKMGRSIYGIDLKKTGSRWVIDDIGYP